MKVFANAPSWFDHMLMAVCAILAVYAASMGIARPAIGLFFVAGIAGATFISFGLGRLLAGTKAFRWDGYVYVVVALICAFRAVALNKLLPDDGYPFQLLMAGVLSWMLMVGSLVAWRDTTQVFQIVPCIALFGLVGAWNTFEDAKYLFFIFLVCAATLFARSHLRSMLRVAEQSEGATQAVATRFLKSDQEDADPDAADIARFRSLRNGPWRWMAGPEWALASALVVVGFSWVGAPVIQSSVQNVAGRLRVDVPMPRPSSSVSATRFGGSENSLRIGTGPRGQMEGRPVIRVKLDRQRYLRGATLYSYGDGNWSNDFIAREYFNPAGEEPATLARQQEIANLRDQEPVGFELEILFGRHEEMYVPGYPVRVPRSGFQNPFPISPDGMVLNYASSAPPYTVDGVVLVPTDAAKPQDAGMPEFFTPDLRAAITDASRATPRVREFAEAAIKGAGNDYDKAMAIKAAIESQVEYNLNAEATPAGRDPVDAFLFETKEGYCDLFASAMALCARSVGLPARTATGFFPNNPDRDRDGYYVVEDVDYHMWCEIYFEGVGWVVFDPTEGAQAVPGGERGASKGGGKSWLDAEWLRNGLDVALIVTTLLVVVLAVRAMFTRKGPASVVERSLAGRAYARFGRDLERRTGKPRRLNETPREYLDRIASELGPQAGPASELTGRFESALYSSVPPTPEVLKGLGESVRDFRRLPKA